MKRIILRIDHLLFSRIVRLIYPKYKRRYGYKLNIRLILQYAILQKLIGFNRFVSWPVHFTSTVLCADRIEKGDNCDSNGDLFDESEGCIKITAESPINIALVKYWGKLDKQLIIPTNSSLSITIDPNSMCSRTTVRLLKVTK